MVNKDTLYMLLSIYAIFFGGFALGLYFKEILKDK